LPKNLLIDPKDLNKMTMTDVVDKVSDINAWRATQKAEANQILANNEATVLHKEYPDGYKWVKLTKPKLDVLEKNLPEGYKLRKSDAPFEHQRWQVVDEQGLSAAEYVKANFNSRVPDPKLKALENFFDKKSNEKLKEALKYEGDTMQHCVGSYCEDIASGSTQIFSLRDSKGMPHTTIEVVPSRSNTIKQMNEGNPTDFDIEQIKGRRNEAPEEEYLPFVLDFLNSGKWGKVKDIEFYGVVDLQDPSKVKETLKSVLNYESPKNRLKKFNEALELNPQANRFMPLNEFKKFVGSDYAHYAAGGSVSVYDPDKIDEIMNSLDKPTGYAQGGSVNYAQGGSVTAYDPDQVDAIANQYM